MSFPTHPLTAKSLGGFALISVLALVSLAALTATAFLASARLERQATLPLGNALRLEWALTAGEMAAQQTIDDATQPASGTVKNFVTTLWQGTNTDDWTKETGYLLIGEPNSTNNVLWTYYAGFSPAGLTNLTTNSIATNMIFINSHQGTYFSESSAFFTRATNGFTNNPAPTNPICTTIPLLGGQTSPPVGWVYLTQRMRQRNSTNASDVTSPVARVAWFIEDLSGKIDAEQMGGLSSSRLTGTNPEEICLTSMTRTNGSQILPSLTTFTNSTNRKLFFTPGLLAKSSISGLTNSDDLRYFATGLREFRPINRSNNNGMLDWIPCGIPVAIQGTNTNSYANGGSSKLSLNQLITLTAPNNVASIARVISNNLPNFKNRSGGMDGNTYVSNIAANIVDYVDTDSNPTYLAPDVRGSEAVAWPNEIIYQVTFSNTDTLATGGGFQYAFKFKQYIETWNIHNTNVPTGSLSISNNLEILVRIPGTGGNTFSLASLATEGLKTQIATNVASSPTTLRPGEFGMLETPEQTLIYFADGATNAANVIFQDCGNNQVVIRPTNSSSAPLTRTIAGMQIYSATNQGNQLTTGPGWLTANQFASAILAPNVYRSGVTTVGGDPRAQFFLRDWQVKCSPYVNYSSPGGRNYEQGNSSFSNSEVNPQLFWPDGGRTIPGDKGANPGNLSQRPNTLYAGKVGTWSTNLSLARINNSGSFSNICELGNIFDPMQWADTTQLPTAAGGQRGLWTNLSTAATNDSRFCGRSSLRIGRPEFTRFAFTNFAGNSSPWIPNMGGSAAALLDLFCVSNGNTGGGPFRTGGKINLNTAPAPVLRALAGGIRLTNDPMLTGVGGSGTNFSVPASMTEAFAQGVMRFRSKYPFLTPSHLCFIGTDPSWPNTNNWPTNSVFGNTNSIALSTAPGNTYGGSARINVTAWNDQAAEEWFTKIYNLSTVQSDNYRAYIVAQLVDSNRTPISPVVRKYVQFFGRPNNPNAGDITNNPVYGVPMYYWPLDKGLKKAYESPY
jgi:hypothetical protein